MREIGRQRRLRGRAAIGLAAMVALGVGGSLAATQASATPRAHAAAGGGGLSVSKESFGSTVESYTGKNTEVFRYTLTNARGMKVQILTYGGIVQDIWVPSRNGREADVTLGFKTLANYVKFDSPPVAPTTGVYFGETVGRYANRIAKGQFSPGPAGRRGRSATPCPSTTGRTPCTAGSSASATTSGPPRRSAVTAPSACSSR